MGAKPLAANKNLRFSHKTLILAHLFIKKGCAASAVTMDNAKIFLQLMSKSRSLAKVRERRLQPVVYAGGRLLNVHSPSCLL